MDILIALTVITLTLPLVTEGGSPLPETKLLTAVYRTDDTQPVAAGVGWPGNQPASDCASPGRRAGIAARVR